MKRSAAFVSAQSWSTFGAWVENGSMSVDRIMADLAPRVVARFLNLKQSTSRHPLVVMVRDGNILDEMEMRSLIRAENNRADYFPTLGTFALLDDEKEELAYARLGVVRVLHTLINLYETREPSTSYSLEELVGHVRNRYETVDPKQISLGLYLAVNEFGAIHSFGRSEDGTEIISFMIAERVLSIATPETAWSDRIALSRRNAAALSNARLAVVGTTQTAEIPPQFDDETEADRTGFTEDGEDEILHPKVFISYAWENREHQNWVRRFAARLRRDGVDAVLDQWDLGFGDNRFLFMERIASVDSIVIVCTPRYAEKSNAREDGVGYESNIITSGIADKAGRQKFIPVLRSGTWSTAIPVWLKYARGADLTGESYSDPEYRKLLRTLHRKNQTTPPLGPIPDFGEDVSVDDAVEQPDGSAVTFQHFQLDEDLGLKERELLDAAAHDPSGQISHRRPIGPDALLVGEKSFLAGTDRATRAAWMAALKSLELRGLVESTSTERHFYSVTDAGYRTSKRLGRFQRWKAKEIKLAANYVGRDPDSIMVPCTGVVEVPATYHPDDVAADGAIMRSIKRDKSLWVEDADCRLLDGLKWEPNAVSFIDEREKVVEFQIRVLPSAEDGTLLLEVPDGHRLKAASASD